jgi:hypothetical protein
VRTSDSRNVGPQLWFNLGFELQVVFPERTLRGRVQNRDNGAHSTFFSRTCQRLERYLTTQNNRLLSAKSETERNNVENLQIVYRPTNK